MVKHDFMEAFDKDLARQGKSDLTRHGYQADLKDYANWFRQTYGEPFKPDKIAYEDVRTYMTHLSKVRKVKPATINHKLAALTTFCRWALSAGILKSDPTAGIKGVKQAKTPPKALERADLNRLLRKAQHSGRPMHGTRDPQRQIERQQWKNYHRCSRRMREPQVGLLFAGCGVQYFLLNCRMRRRNPYDYPIIRYQS